VRLRMIADVPLGAFLSGGVDSSTVVALMQVQSRRPVKTFSIGFAEDAYNEAAHAKMVANHLGTDHTELYVTPENALDIVPMLPSMYDEPFSDSSQIPTFLVSRLARRAVTVSLSGDGGDELFGGYSRYALIEKMWNVSKLVPGAARRSGARVLRNTSAPHLDRAFRLLRPFLPKTLRITRLGEKAHKLAGFLSQDSPEALYYQALSHWGSPEEVVVGGMEPGTVRECIAEVSRGATLEQTMMLTDLVNYLPDDILTKLDRASMAVSLEARVPLLDHRVVEFAWTLPSSFRNRQSQSKWVLRRVLDKYVSPKLIERPKMGFAVPLERWLSGPLREWAESLLEERRLRAEGYFDVAIVRNAWAEQIKGRGGWQYCLWDILMFQAWIDENKYNSITESAALPAAIAGIECRN